MNSIFIYFSLLLASILLPSDRTDSAKKTSLKPVWAMSSVLNLDIQINIDDLNSDELQDLGPPPTRSAWTFVYYYIAPKILSYTSVSTSQFLNSALSIRAPPSSYS